MREPGVRQAAVLATGEGDGRRLVAYVVVDEGAVAPDALQQALAQTLPAYMVPSQIAMLDALPLTPNGKLDRASLPSVEAPAAARTEPLTELETQLVAVWSELLEHEVGPEENFFDAGGHSLLAIRLIARMRTELGVKLTLKALIGAPTISEFAAKIESVRQAAPPAAAAVPTAAPKPAPAVPMSRARGPCAAPSPRSSSGWSIRSRLEPPPTTSPGRCGSRVRSTPDALSRAVATIVRRHEALRTRFIASDGQPMQIVEKAGAAALECVDLSNEADPAAAAERLIDEQTATAFDLTRGPLLRVVLMKLAAQEHVLLIVVHHIVFDGSPRWSSTASSASATTPLPPAASRRCGAVDSYADYAEWQRTQLDPELLERELAHWRAQLDGAPTALELPTDRPRPAVSSLRGARHRHPLSRDLRGALETVARGEGATFFMAVLAAFEVLLYRYSAAGGPARGHAGGHPFAARAGVGDRAVHQHRGRARRSLRLAQLP